MTTMVPGRDQVMTRADLVRKHGTDGFLVQARRDPAEDAR